MSFADIFSLKRQNADESRIQPVLANDMDYTLPLDNRPTTSRGAPPRRKSLSASKRKSMNKGDKAIEFDKIAKSYLQCEKRLIEALRKSSTMSIDEKLDLIVKKRDECSQSQSDIVGGRRKTRRNKKRKSRRKSRKRKRKRKTKRRR